MIEIKNVSKTYGAGTQAETTALSGVSLSIGRGEFLSITGPSGSGKSTLMNLLGLLDTPTHGSYRFNEQNVAKLSDRQLTHLRLGRIGFIFQSYNLLPSLTAEENVALPMVYSGLSNRQRAKRAQQLLAEVGLRQRLHHKPSQLSGGQQQRVAIARALANQPELILADEPTGNLDSEAANAILRLLTQQQAQGTTLVIVTHEAAVSKLARRRIVVKDGRLAQEVA